MAKPAIRGILFDKDGTLFDYDATWLPVNRMAAMAVASGDVELSDRLLVKGGQDPVRDHVTAGSTLAVGNTFEIAQLWQEDLPERVLEDLISEIDEVFVTGGIVHAQPVTDLVVCLGRLRERGYKLGVATHDVQASAERMLARFGALSLFDFLAGYDSGHGTKPGPGMVEGFCRATGLAAPEVAVVGDNLHDVNMGRNAGVGLVVGVLTGTAGRAALAAEADHVLESIAELDALLAGLD